MKNLEKYGVVELEQEELMKVEGGVILWVIGWGVGVFFIGKKNGWWGKKG